MNHGGKRRDKKGRVLRTGEIQKADGRYRFKWTGADGKAHYLHSWRLVATDRTPEGKKDSPPLRELEAQVEKIEQEKRAPMTVLELCRQYVAGNSGVKNTTKSGYRTTLRFLEKNPFGSRRIDEVTLLEARAWLIGLQDGGMSYSSIHTKRGVLRPAFALAVESGLIEKNPFAFELGKCLINDNAQRDAYTPAQQKRFLEFVKKDGGRLARCYNGFFVLFNCGLRVSELCGLIFEDVDLKHRRLTIRRELLRANGMTYVQDGAKTKAGVRTIPIDIKTAAALSAEMKLPRPVIEPSVDGVSGFIFLNAWRKGPTYATNWEHSMARALAKFNATYKDELPPLTPHVCRHTYCTRMATSGISLQTLQYLMGHASADITLRYYTHLRTEQAEEDFAKNGVE